MWPFELLILLLPMLATGFELAELVVTGVWAAEPLSGAVPG